MASKRVSGFVAGSAGSIVADIVRQKFAGVGSIAGFDLLPTGAALATGALGGLALKQKPLAAGASAALGDGVSVLFRSLVPAASFSVGPVSVTGAAVAGVVGLVAHPFLSK